jgi:3-hydroxybutyryl-CoA dehydrogenase
MIGQDINYATARSVHDALDGRRCFRLQPLQQDLVETSQLGRKTGTGVYAYDSELPRPAFGAGPPPSSIAISRTLGLLQPLADALARTGHSHDIASDLPDATLRVDGLIFAVGDGRRLADRTDTDVLIDACRDYASSETLVMTARVSGAARTAAGFAEVLGKRALLIPDRPGQIVLRVLAQLANAAFDAVAAGVAGREEVDRAMRLGANHPEGPIAWAQRYGFARLEQTLCHIAEATRDEIYRPAPLPRGLAEG